MVSATVLYLALIFLAYGSYTFDIVIFLPVLALPIIGALLLKISQKDNAYNLTRKMFNYENLLIMTGVMLALVVIYVLNYIMRNPEEVDLLQLIILSPMLFPTMAIIASAPVVLLFMASRKVRLVRRKIGK